MSERTIGIIMHGVTGRMGKNQHLIRSILAIREKGGVELSNGDRLMPEVYLVGRNEQKIADLAAEFGIQNYGCNIDEALAIQDNVVFFDAASTRLRPKLLKKAIEAGKAVYCEKPIAEDLQTAIEIATFAEKKGVKNGVVHDKLDLPGIRKLRRLRDSGFFGEIVSVRGEFGYWVFEGDIFPSQRPSWNYKLQEGGGIITDMLCHWRYVLDNTIAPVRAVSCMAATHIRKRWDESGRPYRADADDAAYAIFELEGGIIASFNSSWCTRVRRDDLVTIQVDGTHGSAVAGLHKCVSQHRSNTPKSVWNPDQPTEHDFFADWDEVPDNEDFDNAFKVQWEQFLLHVVEDAPWTYSFIEGAKGVQLAQLALRSVKERCWFDVPDLKLK